MGIVSRLPFRCGGGRHGGESGGAHCAGHRLYRQGQAVVGVYDQCAARRRQPLVAYAGRRRRGAPPRSTWRRFRCRVSRASSTGTAARMRPCAARRSIPIRPRCLRPEGNCRGWRERRQATFIPPCYPCRPMRLSAYPTAIAHSGPESSRPHGRASDTHRGSYTSTGFSGRPSM